MLFAVLHLTSTSTKDLPCKWPWGEVIPATDPAASTGKDGSKGKGSSRGRGRSKGSRGRGKSRGAGNTEDSGEVASKKDGNDNDNDREKAPMKKHPFLLTNLVRTGNQMGGASTWGIIQRAAEQLIFDRLVLVGQSLRSEASSENMKFNHEIMKLLGKIPNDFDITSADFSENGLGLDGGRDRQLLISKDLVQSSAEFLRSDTQLVGSESESESRTDAINLSMTRDLAI